MVKLLEKSYKNGCCKRVEQWAIDTDAELANLPTVPAGSCAISSESGITFYANTSGEWPKDPSKYESGGSGGSGGGGEFEKFIQFIGGNYTYSLLILGANTAVDGEGLSTINDFDSVFAPDGSVISVFRENTELMYFYAPQAKTILANAFKGCVELKKIYVPKVETIEAYAFEECANLKEMELKKANTISKYAFNGAGISIVDLHDHCAINEGAFNNSQLETLILRSNKLCILNITALLGTKIITAEGAPTGEGFIYVPSALVPSYITDFVSKIIALATAFGMPMDEPTATYIATAIFRPLEDYTVDGTVTGELDESKI